MPFDLKPIAVPDGFVWQGKLFHLTYSDHIPPETLLAVVRRATSIPLDGYSIAHEDTAEYNDEGTARITEGYEHTHMALIFHAPIKVTGSRKFDVFMSDDTDPMGIRQIHPHIQPKVSMVQMEQLFTQYHAGRKYNITTGKMAFNAPLLHVYHLPPLFEFHRAILEDVVAAPTLLDACVVGQVRVRSVSDVKMLRAEPKAAKRFKHKYAAASFTLRAPPAWHVLHIHGGTGLGKTKWALAQFNNPCLVKPFDSIGCLEGLEKAFDPEQHDGIVLDEANLSFLTRQQVIALFDPDEDCTLDVRFKSFTLPAGVKKIIVSNEAPHKLYPPDPHGAIARRFMHMHITQSTYGGPTPTPAPMRPPLATLQLTPLTQPGP